LALTPVELSVLIGRHTPVEPNPCRVCGAEMTPTSVGGGNATIYRCCAAIDQMRSSDRDQRKAAEDHYRRSEQRITYHGDSRIVAALHELRERRQAAGEDMTVPVGAYAFPNGHGKGHCYYRLRHEGGDRWVVDHDFTYSHDPAHATLEVD
jgi:hypothetical protein